MEIICFEKMNGERIIAEVEDRGSLFLKLKNPMAVHHSPDGAKMGFAPCLYSDPKKMECNLYVHSISTEHIPSEEIVNAYIKYSKQLTSSIIQLDTSVKKVQLNG